MFSNKTTKIPGIDEDEDCQILPGPESLQHSAIASGSTSKHSGSDTKNYQQSTTITATSMMDITVEKDFVLPIGPHKPMPKPPLGQSKPSNFADDITFDSDTPQIEAEKHNGGAGRAYGGMSSVMNSGFYKHHPKIRYFNATPYPPPPRHSLPKTKKRGHHPDDMDIKSKKVKITISSTPCSILNEVSKDISYEFSDNKGSPHEACFEVTVNYPENGKVYKAEAKSKKLAKHTVAQLILKDLGIPVPDIHGPPESSSPIRMEVSKQSPTSSNLPIAAESFPLPTFPTMPSELFNMDFASDEIPSITIPSAVSPSYISPSIINRIQKISLQENPSAALHAILLNEGDLRYDVVAEEGEPHDKCFTMRVAFVDLIKSRNSQSSGEIFFFGKGSSKKYAKSNASRQALAYLLGEEYYKTIVNYQERMKVASKQLDIENSRKHNELIESENYDPEESEYNTQFSDYVSRLIADKYEDIMKGDPGHVANKVIAGIVLTMGSPMIENCAVVAITTGTKCIEGDYISDEGLAVNDCHAEILAVRCLREFIYTQIDRIRDYEMSTDLESGALPDSGSSVLERCGSKEDGKFKLKEGVKFHLYINTSPCGDARIFSPKGLDVDECLEAVTPPGDEPTDTHPNRNNRGVLRAKIEAGEGTLPVINHTGGVQTWDGILQGNALRTMSCSDKICRWNVIGVQGALLSNLIEPIYLSSIILGSLHHPAHLKRAMYGRLEGLKNLPSPYKVNRLKLLMVPNSEKRKVKKSPNHAIAWTCTWNVHEVLSASKGRCEVVNVVSRLAKRIAFIRFLKIYKTESGKREEYANISYDSAKHLAESFQNAKKAFEAYMEESGNGRWISKPFEQDNFAIT